MRAAGAAKAAKKADRATAEGKIFTYAHGDKLAVVVEILCETDFVARNPEFQNMAKEVAMQVTAMKPASVDELLTQEYLRDPSLTIDQLVKQLSGKIGEKFVVNRFVRYEIGE